MKRVRMCVLTVLVALSWAGLARSQGEGTSSEAKSVYDFEVQDIDGKEVKLSEYKGNVVLMVNVASRCGLTPQYKDLQALHEKYKDSGPRAVRKHQIAPGVRTVVRDRAKVEEMKTLAERGAWSVRYRPTRGQTRRI